MTAPSARAPGSLVDAFRVAGPRARWGLGECFDATDTSTGRRVVLKFFHGASARGKARGAVVERLAAIGRLSQTTVLPVVAWGLDDEVPWVAVDPPEGRSLAVWVRAWATKRVAPDGAAVRKLVDRIAHAVSAAHRHKPAAWHGGLNPESVVLDEAQEAVRAVRLMDFGVGLLDPGVWSELPPSWDPRPPEVTAARRDDELLGDVYGLAVLTLAMLGADDAGRANRRWADLATGREETLRGAIAQCRGDLSPALTQVLVTALQKPRALKDFDGARRAFAEADWSPHVRRTVTREAPKLPAAAEESAAPRRALPSNLSFAPTHTAPAPPPPPPPPTPAPAAAVAQPEDTARTALPDAEPAPDVAAETTRMDIAAPTHRPRAATRPLIDLEVAAPPAPQPERTHLIDVRAARALAEHVDAFDAAETVGLGMRLPPGDLMEVRSLTAETLDPFAGYTPPPPTPVPPVALAPLPGIPTSVTFELSDGLSGSTLPVPPSAWTTPSVVPAPPPPSSLPPAYLSAPPPPTAMVTPQAWPSFRPRPAEESLPLPPRDPISLADGRSGAFDRTFVQAAIVGVLVLSLLAVMLSAR